MATRQPKLILAFGEEKSIRAWMKDPRCAVSSRTLSRRVAQGELFEEALSRPLRSSPPGRFRPGKLWTAFGKTLTVRQWTVDPRCTVSDDVLRSRLMGGMNPELAIATPKAKHERQISALGETKSLKAWSRDPRCRISYRILSQRMERGWDIIEAIQTESLSPGNPKLGNSTSKAQWKRLLPNGNEVALEAFGEKKTLREWSDDPRCQVPYLRLRTRLKNNWALQDAISVVPAVGNRNVEAFGESKSLYAWEKDPRCLVTHKAVRWRMDRGETAEEAMSRPSQHDRIRSIWNLKSDEP